MFLVKSALARDSIANFETLKLSDKLAMYNDTPKVFGNMAWLTRLEHLSVSGSLSRKKQS